MIDDAEPGADLAGLAVAVHASDMARCTGEEDDSNRRNGIKPWCQRFAEDLAARGVTVSLDRERLTRALERTNRIEIVHGSFADAAEAVARAYDESERR